MGGWGQGRRVREGGGEGGKQCSACVPLGQITIESFGLGPKNYRYYLQLSRSTIGLHATGSNYCRVKVL